MKAQEFLWGVRFNNEKSWFLANKETYTEKVAKPMKELGQELWRLMEEKHSLGTRLHLSRIYRDARRLHGKGPYKDHLWLSLRSGGGDWTAYPTFYFEIYPETWAYGMVCSVGRADFMRAFRAAVQANPARFDALAEGLVRQGRFTLMGDEYKRPPGEAPTELSAPWFKKKFIWFCHEEMWNDAVCSPDLPRQVFEDMSAQVDFYKFFAEIAARVNSQEEK